MSRYKVIADYPDSPYKIGQILTDMVGLNKYPRVFKPLEWWEGVPFEELPMYLKYYVSGCIKRAVRYEMSMGALWASDGEGNVYIVRGCLPATEQEYNDYKK
jgi:hypothetical protein